MVLALDIGNSFTKYAIYQKDKLISLSKFSSENPYFEKIITSEIKHCVISSVVPNFTIRTRNLLIKEYKIDPYIITQQSKFNIKIEYRTPDSLGIDRICGAEGAFIQYKKENNFKTNDKPIIVIDLGTATTINLIKPQGIFAGGIIAPGIVTMTKSLFNNTAQLPYVDLNEYHEFIGKDTNSCIASGIINSAIGLIERVVDRIKKDFKTSKITIYITGGNAPLIKPYLSFDCSIVSDLILKGANEIFQNSISLD